MTESADGASGGLRRFLCDVAEGASVRLVCIDAGPGLVARLSAMGLVPGSRVRVLNNRGRGPAMVEVLGTRLALGRGMTRKIIVQ